MFTCPYCTTEFAFPEVVVRNVTTYQRTVAIATPCCHRRLLVRPRLSVAVSAAPGEVTDNTDDWGDPLVSSTMDDVQITEPQYIAE